MLVHVFILKTLRFIHGLSSHCFAANCLCCRFVASWRTLSWATGIMYFGKNYNPHNRPVDTLVSWWWQYATRSSTISIYNCNNKLCSAENKNVNQCFGQLSVSVWISVIYISFSFSKTSSWKAPGKKHTKVFMSFNVKLNLVDIRVENMLSMLIWDTINFDMKPDQG